MAESIVPGGAGRGQRKLKNLLLVPRFQLKYATILVAIVAVLLFVLGSAIMTVTDRLQVQATQSVIIAQDAEAQADRAFRESQLNSRNQLMFRIAQAAHDPAVEASLERELEETGHRLDSNRVRVQLRRQELHRQRSYIQRLRQWVYFSLVGSGVTICIVLFLAAIATTHRIVGPVYRLKRLLHQLGRGSYNIKGGPRQGDELIDLFEAFMAAVEALRAIQVSEVTELDEALKTAESMGVSKEIIGPFTSLRARMQDHLDR